MTRPRATGAGCDKALDRPSARHNPTAASPVGSTTGGALPCWWRRPCTETTHAVFDPYHTVG